MASGSGALLRDRLANAFLRRDIRNTTSRINVTMTTTDVVNSGTIVEAAPTTTTTINFDTNATDIAGGFTTTTAPSWFWIGLAVCFIVLALTVANICFFRKKTELIRKAPEGKENLIAYQF